MQGQKLVLSRSSEPLSGRRGAGKGSSTGLGAGRDDPGELPRAREMRVSRPWNRNVSSSTESGRSLIHGIHEASAPECQLGVPR